MAKIKIYKAGELKITIDEEKCISCGLCAEIALKTFELDSKMMSRVKSQGPYDNEDVIKEAVSNCATQAITIEP